MTSYCKKFIGFPLIIPENHSFYQNKYNGLKREIIMSCRETGGAAVIHIILCEYNNSLIEIKKMFQQAES